MSSLLHNRRGSVAFATVVALVPLIGVIALGAEGGSWYVTRQHAQNAADAAAYSGALRLACGLGAIACTDTESVDYRGKQFAAQNSFCNTGDTSYPGSRCTSLATDVAQSVEINQLGTWKGVSGNFVQAVISQQQPAYLAKLLGLSTVNIGAIAVAEVQNPKELCALGLGRYPQNSSALILGGSVDITGNGCGLMSNDTVKYASTPTFSGSGWAVEAVGGCVNSGNCDPGVPYNYYMPAATNPLEQLDSASFNDVTGNAKPCRNGSVTNNDSPCTLSPLSTGAYGDLTVTGSSVTFNAGTYFFYNAKIKINGGTVTGTDVTLVLLGN
ncbi:MAG: pilus assembly protein TadG, partial [Rhizobiales bacterium]|nr:pilus assembly protein TadG [Hyphomicrobiales bacterium]